MRHGEDYNVIGLYSALHTGGPILCYYQIRNFLWISGWHTLDGIDQ